MLVVVELRAFYRAMREFGRILCRLRAIVPSILSSFVLSQLVSNLDTALRRTQLKPLKFWTFEFERAGRRGCLDRILASDFESSVYYFSSSSVWALSLARVRLPSFNAQMDARNCKGAARRGAQEGIEEPPRSNC